jgi:hypothetical protein
MGKVLKGTKCEAIKKAEAVNMIVGEKSQVEMH